MPHESFQVYTQWKINYNPTEWMRFASGWNLISLQESSLSNKILSLFHFGGGNARHCQQSRTQSVAAILLWQSCRWWQLSPPTSAHITCILQWSHPNSDKVSKACRTWKHIYLQGIITLDWRRMINNIQPSALGYIHSKTGKGYIFAFHKYSTILKTLCLPGKNVDSSNPLSNLQKVTPSLEQYLRSSLRR